MTITVITDIVLADRARELGEALGRNLRWNRKAPGMLDLAGELGKCKLKFSSGVLSFPEEPVLPKTLQPSPPLHPLQRMSSQPSAFGQSMWKPWENVK